MRFLKPLLLLSSWLWLWEANAQSFLDLLNEFSTSDSEQRDSKLSKQPFKEELQNDFQVDQPVLDEFAPQENIQTNGVTLQGLDKETARVFIIDAAIGQLIEFGTLKIIVHHCEETPPEERNESMAFLTITEEVFSRKPQLIYSGWMFASSPALCALDHPTYDVWVKGCKNIPAEKLTSGSGE